jgi:hypothetical protein
VEQYHRVLELSGGDPGTPRRLYRSFLAAGLPSPQARVTQTMGTEPDGATKVLALSTLDAITESITSAGLATPDEVSAARTDLAAFIADPRTVIADPRIFSVWAHRPAT